MDHDSGVTLRAAPSAGVDLCVEEMRLEKAAIALGDFAPESTRPMVQPTRIASCYGEHVSDRIQSYQITAWLTMDMDGVRATVEAEFHSRNLVGSNRWSAKCDLDADTS